MKPTITVNSMANFEFWLSVFKQRTKKWNRENLERIKKLTFESKAAKEENEDKIKAHQFILNN